MFKRFNREDDLISKNVLKSSLQRNIRSKVMECYPPAENIPMFSGLMPGEKYKAPKIFQYKCSEKKSILVSEQIAILFTLDTQEQQIYYPTLRLVHQYPGLLPSLYVDSGAIVPILQGADIMIPGLFKSEKEHSIPRDLIAGQIVAIYCHEKEYAIAIGKMLIASKDLSPTMKGHAVQSIHYLGDALWHFVPDEDDQYKSD